MTRHVRAILVLVAALLFMSGVYAEVPHVINYQGRLTNAAGQPYTGAKLVKFTIYDGGGSAVWNTGFITVNFTEGLFTVRLGESPQPALPLADFVSDTAMTLGITVDVDPEITPRTRFLPSAYAVQAKYADIGGGWMPDGAKLRQIDTTQDVVIGSSGSGNEKLQVDGGGYVAAKFLSSYASTVGGAIHAESEYAGGACIYSLLTDGNSSAMPLYPVAVFGGCMNQADGAGGHFYSNGTSAGVRASAVGTGIGVRTYSDSGYALFAEVDLGGNYTGYFDGGKGVYVVADSQHAGTFEASYLSHSTRVVDAQFMGSGNYDAAAVYGKSVAATGFGYGGYFEGGYRGVYGRVLQSLASTNHFGVYGYCAGTGAGSSKYGVYGNASGGAGTNYGVYGVASSAGATNYAGYFSGNVHVNGTLSKSAGAFTIDHPLDPDNRFLQHSFVESPDMMNIYNGNVVLDAGGEAEVTLPEYFEALNQDFRYQLTCIGGYAPVYVSQEVNGNTFRIAGGTPGLKVSWQVTGIRHDAYANAHRIEVETMKPTDQRGLYLHAEELGRSIDETIGYKERREIEARDNAQAQAYEEMARRPKPEPPVATDAEEVTQISRD